MRFSVDRRITMPVYVQIREQIRQLIAAGDYVAGTQLPPASRLAENLQIYRHTALRAFSELEQLGSMVGVQASDAAGRGGGPAAIGPALGARRAQGEWLR